MPHSRNTSTVASTGVRLNALIESALLEADPEHYGPTTLQPPVAPGAASTKRASPTGPSASQPDVLVRPATDPATGSTTVPSASDAFESSSLGHGKVSFNIPSGGGGPSVVNPPSVIASQESLSPTRRTRTNPLSKLAHASDSNHSLADSASSHASLDTITSERELTTPTPPPPLAGRSQAGGGSVNTPGRGRTGARLTQPPSTTGGGGSKYMHTLNLAPPTATGTSSNARTTAASTLLARSRSNSRHRQPSCDSTGSMDRGLDTNPNASTDAISAPIGVGSNRISQLAPTLADRARLARLELAALQSDASAAMRELEAAEAMRKEAEVARMQSERDVESVQRRIEVALKKRDELEGLLDGLRIENDELEQQLGVSGGFLSRYAGYVEGAGEKGKEGGGARSRTASSTGSGHGGGGAAGV